MASDEPNWSERRKELENELVNFVSGTSPIHGDFTNKTLLDNIYAPNNKYGFYLICKNSKKKIRIVVEYKKKQWIPQKCKKCKQENKTCVIINRCISKTRKFSCAVDTRLNSEKKQWEKQRGKNKLTPLYRFETLPKTSIMSNIINGIKS
eukprot:47117_1